MKDFKGDYEYYLEQNEEEAEVMQEKEERAKKLVQENTKATSKMTKAERAMKEKEKKEKVSYYFWPVLMISVEMYSIAA